MADTIVKKLEQGQNLRDHRIVEQQAKTDVVLLFQFAHIAVIHQFTIPMDHQLRMRKVMPLRQRLKQFFFLSFSYT